MFLTFWQATGLSLLTLFGLVKDVSHQPRVFSVTNQPSLDSLHDRQQYQYWHRSIAGDVRDGVGYIHSSLPHIPSHGLNSLFACLHIKAFSYKPYVTNDYPTPRWRSLGHAMNFKETGREIWHGWVYMLRKSRGHEVDAQARREAVLENVFGRSRFTIVRDANGSVSGKGNASEKDLSVSVHVEKEVRVDDERQWLGAGDDYAYGIGYQARRQKEPSEGLELQIEKELARRGYTLRGGHAFCAPRGVKLTSRTHSYRERGILPHRRRRGRACSWPSACSILVAPDVQSSLADRGRSGPRQDQ